MSVAQCIVLVAIILQILTKIYKNTSDLLHVRGYNIKHNNFSMLCCVLIIYLLWRRQSYVLVFLLKVCEILTRLVSYFMKTPAELFCSLQTVMHWLTEAPNSSGEPLEKSRYCKGGVNHVSS